MMDFTEIWTAKSPHAHFYDVDISAPWSTLAPPTGTLFCGHLDGRKMLDSQGVFEEFSRVFRFPVYFGWNWDAFSDCLRDMSWVPAQRYLAVVGYAESLLVDERDDIDVFRRIMKRAADSWGSTIGLSEELGEAAVPFNIVYLASNSKVASVQADFGG
ncbi:barstar family protein [Embleya sp. NBC_00896]|uniref:barstar family protein n=1 Tax=Embleya sp. NBC_00896 TaxID=2975961 RepID=UPI003863E0A4|nr:barstar family protein [Embleya sp. NBC_00896]